MDTNVSFRRLLGRSSTLLLLAGLAAGALLTPRAADAQLVVGGDFDISDNRGTLRGNTAFIRGRAGFGTDRGTFHLINASSEDQDVDDDGYTPGIDFTNLAVTDTSDFVNVANPDQVISRLNFVLADFLNPLNNGFHNQVEFYVNIPNGTAAGIYRGRFFITDTVRTFAANPNGEVIRSDYVFVEIEVLPNGGIELVQSDTNATLDSLTLRGRAGQTVSGVVRIANIGNVPLENVRFDVTDLVATSGTGLRIRRERISFSPEQITSVAFGDTGRVTVTVRIPTGILAGAYRGDLTVQAEGVPARTVPLTVIVTTPGDIVFENNPVYGRSGDQAVIIFNADPGTNWEMQIFDMMALATYRATGGVFPADQAVRHTWPLVNGVGESVAGGVYYVIINAVQDGERRQLRGKLMVIR